MIMQIQNIDKLIQDIINSYSNYINDIEDLVYLKYPKDKAIKMVAKKYKEFEIN